jgi:hypothetical protein
MITFLKALISQVEFNAKLKRYTPDASPFSVEIMPGVLIN